MKKPEKFPKVPNGQLVKDGYSKYPESENIYNKFDKKFEIHSENIAKNMDSIQIHKNPTWNEKNFNLHQLENDLDIPKSEFDNDLENFGIEDEENNGYSIGGDHYNNLDENENK